MTFEHSSVEPVLDTREPSAWAESHIKVFFVINTLGPGGTERSLVELLPVLIERAIHPMVVCLDEAQEGFEEEVIALDIPIRKLRSSGHLGKLLELRRLLRAFDPDLVQTTIFESDVLGRIASIGSGRPVLTSLVNMPYTPMRLQDPSISPAKLRLVQAIDGWTARNLTTHFHAVTHEVKRAAVESLGIAPTRVTVVERGRDPVRLGKPGARRRQEARRSLGLAPDDVVLIAVGRQEFQKGHRYLLEAVSLLRPARPRLMVLVAGRQGVSSAHLTRLASALTLTGRVRFLGHRTDVPDLLAAADIFLFPSLYEGFGGALAEAMALGLPIVASDLPTLREVVEPGGNALLVPPGDPRALAAAIDRLLGDPAMRASFGARGRQIFEARFTLDRAADRMVDLYRWLGARPRHPTRART